MRSFVRLGLALLAGGAGASFAASARADVVAVLPFVSAGSHGSTGASSAPSSRANAYDATRGALVRAGHTLPGESSMTTADVASRGAPAGTMAQYQAAGRAAGASWTVAGDVEPQKDARGALLAVYRLELSVCQVETGRVESLARVIDPSRAAAQVAEMVSLLVRPEGIGEGAPAWERGTAPSPPTPPAPAVAPTTMPAYGPPPARSPTARDSMPFAVGLGPTLFGALRRGDGARGSSVAGGLSGSFGYDLAAVPGLSLRGDAGVAFVGPQSLTLDAGARYLFPLAELVGDVSLALGPEATVGIFVPFGGDRDLRARLAVAAPLVARLVDPLQVELAPELSYAPGGTVSLVFLGVTARAVLRF